MVDWKLYIDSPQNCAFEICGGNFDDGDGMGDGNWELGSYSDSGGGGFGDGFGRNVGFGFGYGNSNCSGDSDVWWSQYAIPITGDGGSAREW